jgi:hypothetical protein
MLTEHKFFLAIDRLTLNQLNEESLASLIEKHFGQLPIQTKMVRKILDTEQWLVYSYVDLFQQDD